MRTLKSYKIENDDLSDHLASVATLIVKITLNVKIFTLRVNDPPLM